MRQAAILITKTLNPIVTSLATIAIAIFIQQMPLWQEILWFILGLLVAAVPTVVLYLGAKNGEVSSFWAPEGKERIKAFWAWVGVAAAYVILAALLAAPKLVLALGLILLVLGIVNLLVSSSFKLSVHSELITLLVLVSVLSISINLIYLALLILLVAWSRLYLKEHTFSEVSFGILSCVITVYLVFAFLGLATF